MPSTSAPHAADTFAPAPAHPLLRFLAAVVKGSLVLTAMTAVAYVFIVLAVIGGTYLVR